MSGRARWPRYVAVRAALAQGTLVRPDRCEKCATLTRVVAVVVGDPPVSLVWWCYRCRYYLGDPPEGPRPRPAPPPPSPYVSEWCAALIRNQSRPCSRRGRYEGADGFRYCGHHRRSSDR